MKKRLIFFSLVSAVLAFASCKLEKGGTIEVTNGSTYNASITIMKGLSPVDGGLEQRAAPNEKVTFSIDEDGNYTVNANFYQTLPVFTGHGTEEAVLLGGNKVSVKVTPSK